MRRAQPREGGAQAAAGRAGEQLAGGAPSTSGRTSSSSTASPGDPRSFDRAGPAAGALRPVPAGALAGGRGGDQLPALLRHQRPRRHPGRGRATSSRRPTRSPSSSCARGKVHGLRIDHPDGLFDPSAYFLRLQERYFLDQARQARRRRGWTTRRWPAVSDALLRRWRMEAATDPTSPLRRRSTWWWRRSRAAGSACPTTGRCTGPPATVRQPRQRRASSTPSAGREFTESLREVHRPPACASSDAGGEEEAGDARVACRARSTCSPASSTASREMNRRTRDFTLNSLRRALDRASSRTSPSTGPTSRRRPGVDERDAHYIEWTIARARAARPDHQRRRIFELPRGRAAQALPRAPPAAERAGDAATSP